MAKKCVGCAKEAGFLKGLSFQEIKGAEYCYPCAMDLVKRSIADIKVTTTATLDGHRIKRYIEVESAEVVLGSGPFSEFAGDVSDFFGSRSTAFEKKLAQARKTAMNKLRYVAFELGGNAIVGIDLDFTEFSNNRVGIIANGTVVEVEQV